MTTEKLNEFLVLANTRSFSKAAKKLFISQSVLSRHIAAMEEELGTELFFRDRHTVSLTKAGKLLERDGAELMRHIQEAAGRISTPNLEARGKISILCSKSAMGPKLLNFFTDFKNKYEEITLDIDISDGAVYGSGDYDLVFSFSRRPAEAQSTVKAEKILSEPAYLVLPPNHRLLENSRIYLSELSGDTLLLPKTEKDDSLWDSLAQKCRLRTGQRVQLRRVPNVETAMLYVGFGSSVTVVPKHMAKSDNPEVKLVEVADGDCDFNVWLLYSEFSENNASRLLRKELEAYIGG